MDLSAAHRLKLGWAMTAIRDDEEAASACGINIFRFKLFSFALTAVFGALLVLSGPWASASYSPKCSVSFS
jgi:ABC-type branched-subunit amino acid transport system permease subunit